MFKVRTYPSVEQIYNHMLIQCKMGATREKTIIRTLNYTSAKEWVQLPSVLKYVSPRKRGNNIHCYENLRYQHNIFLTADLYRMCGDPVRENEAFQMHCNFSQMLLKDHFQASQMTEHNLIHWTEGSFPMLVGNPPSTSDTLL